MIQLSERQDNINIIYDGVKSMHDKDYLKKCFETMREKYKPELIECLFIAESPPAPSKDEFIGECKDLRFFYNSSQTKRDFLFKNLMEIIFGNNFESDYKKNKNKCYYLSQFQKKGFYLIDAVEYPINDIKDSERNIIIENNKKELIDKLNCILLTKETPIILIKQNVYGILYTYLKKEGFNVVNTEPIPFPSHGHQKEFKSLVGNILNKYCK